MRMFLSARGNPGAENAVARIVGFCAVLAACQPAWAAPPAPPPVAASDVDRYGDAMPAPPALGLPPPVPGPLASRPLDQLWLVSCRGLGAAGREQNFARLSYWRYVTPSGWVASSRDEFLLTGGSVSATSVFVPGNGYSGNQARDLGAIAYRRLVAGLSDGSPLRFVIWSWPSDHINAGPVQDARVKAARTTLAAWYLARWLDELEPLVNASIIGCSFGARVVGETLELRGGGRLGPYQLVAPASARSQVRVVLVSAAIDNDWLLPGRRLGHALSHVERLLLINNTSDAMLRRYGWLYGRRNSAAALGYTGLVGAGRLAGDSAKVRQIDATDLVGRRHGFMYYFTMPRIVGWMRPYVFDSSFVSTEIAAQRANHRPNEIFARKRARSASQ